MKENWHWKGLKWVQYILRKIASGRTYEFSQPEMVMVGWLDRMGIFDFIDSYNCAIMIVDPLQISLYYGELKSKLVYLGLYSITRPNNPVQMVLSVNHPTDM